MVHVAQVIGDISPDVLELVKKTAENEEFKTCTVIKTGSGAKGEGFAGVMTFVQLQGETIGGQPKSLHIAVKSSQKNENYRKDFPVTAMFNTEISMYTKVFPAFQKFQQKFNLPEMFTCVTNCLHSQAEEGREGIVFPNLKELGFTMWDRKKPMNEEHVVMILKEYAKYHAISFAMKEYDKKEFEELGKSFSDNFVHFLDQMRDVYLKNLDHSINLFDNEEEQEVVAALKKFKGEFFNFMRHVAEYKDEFSVITHGDCWCNNMMFQYEDYTSLTPRNMKLIDFQLSKVGTLVQDLSYFFYCSASREIIENFDYYMKDVYYEALSSQIRHFGGDPSVLYPYEKLKEEWRNFGKYGFVLAMIVCRICYAEKDEIPDFVDAADKGDTMAAIEVKPLKNEAAYNDKIRSVVLHLFRDNCF